MFDDKYKELEKELEEYEKEYFAVQPTLSDAKERHKMELLPYINEIKSGKKYHKKGGSSLFYKLKVWYWRLIMRLYYKLR